MAFPLEAIKKGPERSPAQSGEVIPFVAHRRERMHLSPEGKEVGLIEETIMLDWRKARFGLSRDTTIWLAKTTSIPDIDLPQRVSTRKSAIASIDRKLAKIRKDKTRETNQREEALIAIRTGFSTAQAHEARQLKIIHRAENERRKRLADERQEKSKGEFGTSEVIYRTSEIIVR